jgi:hypothetical protein
MKDIRAFTQTKSNSIHQSSMSLSASAAFASASAAATLSAGTRSNLRPLASQIHESSSSKGFSPSWTECRLLGGFLYVF